jgi:hypothetical protein
MIFFVAESPDRPARKKARIQDRMRALLHGSGPFTVSAYRTEAYLDSQWIFDHAY